MERAVARPMPNATLRLKKSRRLGSVLVFAIGYSPRVSGVRVHLGCRNHAKRMLHLVQHDNEHGPKSPDRYSSLRPLAPGFLAMRQLNPAEACASRLRSDRRARRLIPSGPQT